MNISASGTKCLQCGEEIDRTSAAGHTCSWFRNNLTVSGSFDGVSTEVAPSTSELVRRLSERVEALERRVAELERRDRAP